MAQSAYVGLAVSSQSTSTLETATFDNVSVSTVAAPTPVITSVSASTAAVGTQVLINGVNFGAVQNGGEVRVNGIPMTINAWSSAAITFTVPAGATSGRLVVLVAPSMNASNPAYLAVTPQPLPSPWLDADIGSVSAVGSATYSNGVFTVKGGGSVYSTAESLHYVYQTLTGDGTITAHVTSWTAPSGSSQAAVMIRESLLSGAREAYVYEIPNGMYLYSRLTPGTYPDNQLTTFGLALGAPHWLRLARSGNSFTAFASLNGADWTQVGPPVTIPMAQTVYIGTATSGGSGTGILSTDTFDSISITTPSAPAPVITSLSATTASVGQQVQIYGANFGANQGNSQVELNNAPANVLSWSDSSIIFTVPAGATSGAVEVLVAPGMNSSNAVALTVTTQPLPSPWLDSDVGAVPAAGSATYSGGVFTVKGAAAIGASINGVSLDSFHYVYQRLTGDGSIIAHVTSWPGMWAQAAIMIRETMAGNSAAVYVDEIPNGAYLNYRSSAGGSITSQSTTFSVAWGAPYWEKLVRNGNTFSGYVSLDAVTWTQIGAPVTVPLAQTVYIGMATSMGTTGNGTTLSTDTFDNVLVTVGTTPYISGISPLSGGVGTSVIITGSNFGAAQGTSKVKFNGAEATSISSWSDSQIVALVPNSIPPGPGPVTVTVNNIVSNASVIFTAYHPVIASLTPPAGAVGAKVTITGSGLGYQTYTSSVTFNGVPVTYAYPWNNTSIVVYVPTGATTGPVVVNYNGFLSDPVQFTVQGVPTVSSISPTSGLAGSTVTISGSGFGAVQSNSSAALNGVNFSSIISWNDTEIQAVIPQSVSTGPVTVTVGGLKGTGPDFQVLAYTTLTNSLGYMSHYIATPIHGQWYVTDADGGGCSSCTVRGVIHNTFDSKGNLLSTTDEAGHQTSYTYDPITNNLLSVTRDAGGLAATTSYTYNSFNEVLTATDPLGKKTTNVYDAKGNLTSTTTPAPDGSTPGSVTQFGYDPSGNGELVSITDPLNHVTNISYTPEGYVSSVTDAQNHTTSYQYDARGNRTAVIDPINGSAHPTSFTYDAVDRLTRTTYPDGTHVDFVYDYRGRRTTVTDQNQKPTTYAYDDEDRLTSVTDANQGVTHYAYDTESQLQTITDANNHATTFHYDSYGRVTQTDFPSSYSELYDYDAVGNLAHKTDRKGHVIHYVYDGMNRLTTKSYPDTTSVAYTYDLASRMTQVTDPTGAYTFVFDYMGRLVGTSTQYSFLPGTPFAITYNYDAVSNRIGMVDPQGASTSYVYDTLNRLQTLTSPAGSFGFSYDPLSVLHQVGTSTPLDGATYTYDNAGTRLTRRDKQTNATTNYGYDSLNQLTSATGGSSESYTYDAVGNRLSSLAIPSYTVNNSNQLTATSTATYTYDNNGNTITRSDASGTTAYTWDVENRLTQVALPGSGGDGRVQVRSFGAKNRESNGSRILDLRS